MRSGEEFAGRFVLKEVIGTGRNADVWLAHDKVVGQDVVLKPERLEGAPEDRAIAVRRLLGEPRAMAKFRDHPHVVTLFDVVAVPEDEDRPETYWFITEYVPGGGLHRQPPMPPVRVARLGAQLADALAALHKAGIVHCDVKPANIGFGKGDSAKLLDFGSAYRFGGTETISANGPFSFTPDYAAPELVRGNVPQSASDVFCLGTTLYALVTGSPPRGRDSGEDGDHAEVSDGKGAERLRYWKAEQGFVEMDADAVGPLYPVLAAMLRRDPQRRPDAAEVKRRLEAVAIPGLSDLPTEPGPEPGPKPSDTVRSPARPWWRRPPFAPALGIGAALALALGLVFLPGDSDSDGGEDRTAPSPPGQSPPPTTDSDTTDSPTTAPNPKAQSLIGDPHTADLCALADAARLDQFGEAKKDVDYGNFDRCDVIIRPDGKTRIDVEFAFRKGSQPEISKPLRTIGEIDIVEHASESEECELRLVPPDAEVTGILGIRANKEDGEVTGGGATLCTIADSAARSAAEFLTRGPLPRRSPPYPDDSLAWMNACELLDARALSVVPGLKAGSLEAGVENWDCEWSSNVDELVAEVMFYRDQVSEGYGSPLRLSGYDTYVVPKRSNDDSCTAFVKYREYGGQDAGTAAEMLRLNIEGQRPMGELCEMVTDLAGSAAAELRAR